MRILIAEDDPISNRVLQTTLTNWGHEVLSTTNGLAAWTELQKEDSPRLAIMDWMMPGIEGPEVCRRVRADAKTAGTYVILLTALSEKAQMVAGIEAGADDYLTKPFDCYELRVRLQAGSRIVELQNHMVQQVIQLEAAIVERKRAEETLRTLSLTDDLTGLYNRRGFFTLAEHSFKIARRAKQCSLLFYADLDGLKKINDTMGHTEGSRAIATTAAVLRQTFRTSDIVARIGGDEFAVLAQNASMADAKIITARLKQNLQDANRENRLGYELSLSIGAILIELESDASIEELLCRADRRMYQQKDRNKLRARQLKSKTNIGSLLGRR